MHRMTAYCPAIARDSQVTRRRPRADQGDVFA
jgi:hypothetical protein